MANKTKILLLDIENSPNLAYVWAKYEQNVIAYEEEWHMLSFAYKWLGESKVKSYALPDFKGYKKDPSNDLQLIMKLWELLDEADIVMGHNSVKFDIRKTFARFLYHGLTAPSPFKQIDTIKIARKHFMLNSNKLTDISKYLGLGEKIETGGFGLWLSCMKGDMDAWKKMVKYNKHDVELLELVYNRLLPFIDNHPNVNILTGKTESCPACGSSKMQKRGFSITRTGKVQRFQCQDCAVWSTGKSEKVTEIR